MITEKGIRSSEGICPVSFELIESLFLDVFISLLRTLLNLSRKRIFLGLDLNRFDNRDKDEWLVKCKFDLPIRDLIDLYSLPIGTWTGE